MSEMIPTSARSNTTNSHLGEGAQVNSTTNRWLAMPTENAEFEMLEPGAYNGVCVGLTLRNFRNYNNPDQMDEKVQFVFQIVEGGQQFYLRSRPCKITLNEKSNLYLLINSWTKATLERMSNGFSCDKMVGYGAQLVTTTREGKDGKVYAELANILPLKKGTKVQVTPAEIPAYLARGVIDQLWAPGITVKPETTVKAAPDPNAAYRAGAPVNDAAPDFGLGVPAATMAAQTKTPPAAQVTQNGNPAEFMGVTNPPAQPATAAEAPESDDDSDLPF